MIGFYKFLNQLQTTQQILIIKVQSTPTFLITYQRKNSSFLPILEDEVNQISLECLRIDVWRRGLFASF